MTADERAALVEGLRLSDSGLDHQIADLIEADGKRLALAEKAIADIGEAWRNLELPFQPVGNIVTSYYSAKEALN